MPFYFINLLPTLLLYISILLAGARGGVEEGAGGTVGRVGWHVHVSGSGQHVLGICEDDAGAKGGTDGEAGSVN